MLPLIWMVHQLWGVAVIFVAQIFGITLSPSDLVTVIITATLASIGTSGVPSVGLITLGNGIPERRCSNRSIALIMGIDRILIC